MDKVSLLYQGREIVADVDLSHNYIKPGEIGILRDVVKKYGIKAGETIGIAFTKSNTLSIDSLKKALNGKKLNEKEVLSIMKDIGSNRFTETLTTYYSAL